VILGLTRATYVSPRDIVKLIKAYCILINDVPLVPLYHQEGGMQCNVRLTKSKNALIFLQRQREAAELALNVGEGEAPPEPVIEEEM
jgi:hypothetical protein